MDQKIHTELERASELFYQWRLREAYTIFKRYFDRLPFKPESGHPQYVGMFARTLFELGKTRELEFYVTTLESWYKKSRSPEIGYQLAYLYLDPEKKNLKKAKEILEEIISSPEISLFRDKAKVVLAYCYDKIHNDRASVKKIIESIPDSSDLSLERVVQTWKAKILKDEGRFDECLALIDILLEKVTVTTDWYAHVTALIIRAYAYFEMGDIENTQQQVVQVYRLIEGRPAKTIQNHLSNLELALQERGKVNRISVSERRDEYVVEVNGRSKRVGLETVPEKLLLALIKKKFLEKPAITKSIYKREYAGEEDDKLVYSQIHAVRNLMHKLGLPRETLQNVEGGYRFMPEVLYQGEES